MANTTQIIWNAPSSKPIGNVAPGSVVMVQARPQNPADILVPTYQGIVPHVQYRASVPPTGTGGAVRYNPYDGDIIDYNAGEMPTSQAMGEPEDQFIYDVDLGKPFPCPWAGTITLIGGARPPALAGTTIPCNVSIVRSGPSDRPLIDTTITFRNVPDNANLSVPRGAYAVTAAGPATLDFTVWGTTRNLFSTPIGGFPQPIGDYAMGTFSATPGNVIQQLTFYVAIG